MCWFILFLVPCCVQDLYKSASFNLTGPVDFRHTFVDMSNTAVMVNGSEVSPSPSSTPPCVSAWAATSAESVLTGAQLVHPVLCVYSIVYYHLTISLWYALIAPRLQHLLVTVYVSSHPPPPPSSPPPPPPPPQQVHTCSPAMGYSFAAGTIDGPGAFNFEQGGAILSDTRVPADRAVSHFCTHSSATYTTLNLLPSHFSTLPSHPLTSPSLAPCMYVSLPLLSS